MTLCYVKLITLLSLAFFLAIIPFQGGFCDDTCANLDEVCSTKEDNSTFPPCCPRDRIENIELKCKPTSEDIGTCVDKNKEE